MTGDPLGFAELHDVLARWPDIAVPATASDGLFERIRQILVVAQTSGLAGSSHDIAPLLRHVLRRHSLRTATTAQFRVPSGAQWPSARHWARFGIGAHSETSTHILIEATAWEPDWLSRTDVPVFEDAFKEHPVRRDWTTPIDPFLAEASGFDSYVTPGQREAVRSAFLVAPGETLVVFLPTGSGKSLVAQAPVLTRGVEGGLTLCIVPTTSLALDQARQMSQMMAARHRRAERRTLAWHSGLSIEDKAEVKQAIRDGLQGILYCSPEAATGALLPSLYAAARSGFLDYLVVDEAHLLSQWGDGFRPAFQMIAGTRRGLLRECPGSGFRTILMSATLTTEAVETIDALFGPAETIQMIASVHIRPEPQYWVHREDNRIAKDRKILQAIRHAPRPLILYVTKRDDARRWCSTLRAEGYGRVETFHGQTPDSDRQRIIKDWSGNRIDIVVATSAFGVGIDKSDVRAVIHGAVPETVDRFYQEVGRGGRDGAASASMLVYSGEDLEVAERIGSPSLISEELGFERWEAMVQNSMSLDPYGLHLKVNLSTVPHHLSQQTDYNEAWNMRTLIMMARAGFLELDAFAPAPVPRDDEEDDDAFDLQADNYWSDYFASCIVKLHEPGHRDREVFASRIQIERSRSFMAADANASLLKALVGGDSEIGALLQRLYQSYVPGRAVVVSPSCGGCPAHRRMGETDLAYVEPAVFGIERIGNQDIAEWTRRFPHLATAKPIILVLPDTSDGSAAMSLVEDAVALFNVREVGVPRTFLNASPALRTLHKLAAGGFVMLQTLEDEARAPTRYPLARVTVLGPGPVPPHVFDLSRPLHLVVASASTPDPWHPARRLGETGSNVLTLEQFRSGVRS